MVFARSAKLVVYALYGRDVASAVDPHFDALRSAASRQELNGLGLDEFGLMLQVGGAIVDFPKTGLDRLWVARDLSQASIHLSVPASDIGRLGASITSSVRELPALLSGSRRKGFTAVVDKDLLAGELEQFLSHYQGCLGTRQE
jgi:hypothetical protein